MAGPAVMVNLVESPAERHRRIPKLPQNRFCDTLVEGLAGILVTQGYKRFNASDLEMPLQAKGLWPTNVPLNLLGPDEYLFSRSAGVNSNFFVFVQKIHDSVIILTTNPRTDPAASSMTREEVYIRREFKNGEPYQIAGNMAQEIGYLSSFKPVNDYRGQFHNHLGTAGVLYPKRQSLVFPVLFDDGMTYFLDFVRAAVLTHTDIVTWSPHNWLSGANDRARQTMSAIFDVLGIVFPTAVEISAPLESCKASGPHMLVIGTEDAMRFLHLEILAKRDPKIAINSCYRGMTLFDMLPIVKELRNQGQLIFGFPHPWNDSSIDLGFAKILRLESTGLISAVDTGQITLERAVEIAKDADFIGAFNPSLTNTQLDISNTALRTLIGNLISRLPGKLSLTTHAATVAIASELGKNATFDPDDHRILPLSTRSETYTGSGYSWGAGHTSIRFSPDILEFLAKSNRKLLPEEFIKTMLSGKAIMHPIFFASEENGFLKLVQGRSARNNTYRMMDKQLSDSQNTTYVNEFLRTVGEIGSDAFDIISG